MNCPKCTHLMGAKRIPDKSLPDPVLYYCPQCGEQKRATLREWAEDYAKQSRETGGILLMDQLTDDIRNGHAELFKILRNGDWLIRIKGTGNGAKGTLRLSRIWRTVAT